MSVLGKLSNNSQRSSDHLNLCVADCGHSVTIEECQKFSGPRPARNGLTLGCTWVSKEKKCRRDCNYDRTDSECACPGGDKKERHNETGFMCVKEDSATECPNKRDPSVPCPFFCQARGELGCEPKRCGNQQLQEGLKPDDHTNAGCVPEEVDDGRDCWEGTSGSDATKKFPLTKPKHKCKKCAVDWGFAEVPVTWANAVKLPETFYPYGLRNKPIKDSLCPPYNGDEVQNNSTVEGDAGGGGRDAFY